MILIAIDFFVIHVSAFSRSSSRQEYGSTDPSFTMRRKMEHLREEMEQIQLLRQVSIPNIVP